MDALLASLESKDEPKEGAARAACPRRRQACQEEGSSGGRRWAAAAPAAEPAASKAAAAPAARREAAPKSAEIKKMMAAKAAAAEPGKKKNNSAAEARRRRSRRPRRVSSAPRRGPKTWDSHGEASGAEGAWLGQQVPGRVESRGRGRREGALSCRVVTVFALCAALCACGGFAGRARGDDDVVYMPHRDAGLRAALDGRATL